jgi:large subunit ribosomal protein L25
MENVLTGYPREKLGTDASENLRKQEKIPAVLYGKGVENVHFYIEKAELQKALRLHEKLLNIKIGKKEAIPTLIQEIQYEPVGGDMLHIDFHVVKLDEAIEVDVSIETIGSELSPGIQEGGNLEIHLHEITVSCFPDRIPEKMTIDVSGMVIGDSKTVGDLEVIEGVEIISDSEEVILSITQPIDVEAETDIEESLQELEGAEPTVQKQKEPSEAEGEDESEKKGS